ncbi:hypothetical protein TNCV_451491 [Trichonephila clavipes]|nr:hypothetical protein TNCV_451491 [Trichonephila clavipes]
MVVVELRGIQDGGLAVTNREENNCEELFVIPIATTLPHDKNIKVNVDDIEELIMGHEDELTIELQEILNEEHQETQ